MKLTWLGHACFLLERDGYTILLDPYTGVEGYPPLRAAAHQVFCSHQHFDHNAVDRVEQLPARECPFAVREVPAFHDDQGGAARGENTIRVFSAGGVSAAHLGDLGHQLSAEQVEAIGPVDLVMVPVGGTYTAMPPTACPTWAGWRISSPCGCRSRSAVWRGPPWSCPCRSPAFGCPNLYDAKEGRPGFCGAARAAEKRSKRPRIKGGARGGGARLVWDQMSVNGCFADVCGAKRQIFQLPCDWKIETSAGCGESPCGLSPQPGAARHKAGPLLFFIRVQIRKEL